MNQSQLRAIVKADNARRAAREVEEDALLATSYSPCPEGVDPYLWDRGITGAPSQRNRDYKATRNCWDRGLRASRTVGIAPGTANESDGTPTVAVTINGSTTIVPVSAFRGKRETRAAVRVARPTTPEVLRLNLPSIRAGETY